MKIFSVLVYSAAVLVCMLLSISPVFSNPLPEPVSITEFSTNPDWIEVYGYPDTLPYVIFVVGSDTVSVTLKHGEITGYSQRYIVLDQSNTTGFDLPEEGGYIETVAYLGFEGLKYGTQGPFPAPPPNESAAATRPDYFPYEYTWNLDTTPTPGYENDIEDPAYGASAVVINEVYPGDDSGDGAFIEFYNNDVLPVDLGGWSVVANRRYVLPAGTIIGGRERYVIDESGFRDDFRLLPDRDTLCLQDADGILVEKTGWSDRRRMTDSLGRYPDGFATHFFSYDTLSTRDFREAAPTMGAPNVESYSLTSVAIEQDSVTVAPGRRYQFYCGGTDEIGNSYRISAAWEIEGDIGTVDDRGVVTGGKYGTGTLTAEYKGLTSSVVLFSGIAGSLDNDAVWTKDLNPYRVVDRFVILPGVSLTIEPGVKVIFDTDSSFIVYGTMNVTGKEKDPVVFTSGKEIPSPGDWYGIQLLTVKSTFNYCVVEYSTQGLYAHGSREEYDSMPVHEISNSRFNNNEWGVVVSDGKATVKNCVFTGGAESDTRGIFLSHSDSVYVVNNTFYGLTNAVNMRHNQPVIVNNCMTDCEYGISAHDNMKPVISFNNVVASERAFFGGFAGTGIMDGINVNGHPCDKYFNISEKPLFADPAAGDFRHLPGSPCIDAGDPGIIDPDGTISDIGAFSGEIFTGVQSGKTGRPDAFSLEQNYPNPFNPHTTIRFTLRDNGYVSLNIYAVSGQKVRTLVQGHTVAGIHTVSWDGTNDSGSQVSSGVYIYRLGTEEGSASGTMALVR